MFSVNVRYVQNSDYLDKILFTVGKLRNYINLTAVQRFRAIHKTTTANLNISKRNFAKGNRNMSGYSVNTIMPHYKEFQITEYDIIGFDLDCTLLRYELNNMVLLVHELLKGFLVNEKNYPKELLNHTFESNFLQKGLFIDSERGNVLKLCENGTILKAAHGTRFMNDNEICKVYGDCRKWDVAQQYMKDPLSAWNGPIAEKLRTLLDYFDIAAALVFAQAVDVTDSSNSSSKYSLGKNDYVVWPDVLAGLFRIYSREYFTTGESAYFEALKENPTKFLLKTDSKVLEFLKQLKTSGKALYLLTGSNIDFAHFTASYALGPQWYKLFDYTIAFAKKPGFFSTQRQFLKINNLNEVEGSEIPLHYDIKPNNWYSQGNWQQLKKSICKFILHKSPEKVKCLYVGDNLIQDIYTPDTIASIDTVVLSEELLENDNNYVFKSLVQSSLWGSYFSVDGISTFWSKIIKNHSQLCVSHLNVVAQIFNTIK